MDAAKEARLQALTEELSALLYEETNPEQVKTLEGIETAVRGHLLERVGPAMGNFLSQSTAVPTLDAKTQCPKHHRTVEYQQESSSLFGIAAPQPLEPLPGKMLPAGERKRIVSASGRRHRRAHWDTRVGQYAAAFGSPTSV